MARLPQLPHPAKVAEWKTEAERLGSHTLNDITYHGWPSGWVNAPPHFEQVASHNMRFEVGRVSGSLSPQRK
jgi:hypothetical protein